MSRSYTHVKVMEREIFEQKAQGKCNREIREQYGLSRGNGHVKNLYNLNEPYRKNTTAGTCKLRKKHELKAKVIGKLEYYNPAGSVKDRIAKAMIDDAEEKGLLKPDSVIIELPALTLNDFDFNALTLNICKNYARHKNKDLILEPKTLKSKRVITIPPPFLANLVKGYAAKLYDLPT